MNTISHLNDLPTEPRERCIALIQQGIQRASVRQRVRETLENGIACEISFGKLNGTLFGDGRLKVKLPKNIAWRVRGRLIELSLSEVLDGDDTELHRLLPQHSETLSGPASGSVPDHRTDPEVSSAHP